MRRALPVAAAVFAASLAACSSSPSNLSVPVDNAPFASIDAANEVDGGAAAPACNAIANQAADVAYQFSSDTAPVGSGGTVADGTYALSSAVVYPSNAGDAGLNASASITLSVSGSTWQLSSREAEQASTLSATFAPSGTSFTLTETCPTDEPLLSGTFTASAGQIVLASTTTDGNVTTTTVTTYTK